MRHETEMRQQVADRYKFRSLVFSRFAVADAERRSPSLSFPSSFPLNEELTIGRFVDWCREGLDRAGIRGDPHYRQLLRSNRRNGFAQRPSAEVAEARPAGVYRRLTKHLRGDYVLMGDATAARFSRTQQFMACFHKGYEYVWDRVSRLYRAGLMPPLHRYLERR
jgi:hypothetical protein